MNKDYLEFECCEISTDKVFISDGHNLCIECVENGQRAAVCISRDDIEKLLPYLLNFYYRKKNE